jgi:hypothetical protein
MVCGDGMAVMTNRTTFALDAETIRRLKRLAARWQVSQAEVVRRAVAQADGQPDPQMSDAVTMLFQLQESSERMDAEQAELYLRQVRADRRKWRSK